MHIWCVSVAPGHFGHFAGQAFCSFCWAFDADAYIASVAPGHFWAFGVRRTRAFFWAFGVPRWAFGVRRTKGI